MTTYDLDAIRGMGEALLAKLERADHELDEAMEAGDGARALAAATALAQLTEQFSDFDAEYNGLDATEAMEEIADEVSEQMDRIATRRIYAVPGEKKLQMFSEELARLAGAQRAHDEALAPFLEAVNAADALAEAIDEDARLDVDEAPEERAAAQSFAAAMGGGAGAEPIELKVLGDLQKEVDDAAVVLATGEALQEQLLEEFGWDRDQWAELVRYKARLFS